MASDRVDLDARVIKAISHPLRHRVLLALDEGVRSPNQIAQELDQPLGRVSHHVRVLARLGAIELVETRQRRGAVEHFYRASVRPMFDDASWAKVPRSLQQAVVGQYLGRILRDVQEAAGKGSFEQPRAHLSYTLLDLDEKGLDEVGELLSDTVRRLLEIRSASTERLDETGAPPIRTELALLHFERHGDSG